MVHYEEWFHIHLGLRDLDEAYSVVMGPVVASNDKPGPNYTSDAAIFKECDEEENGSLSFMVQVNARPEQGV